MSIIGIVIICTNLYYKLGIRFIENFDKYYKGNNNINFYLFTDKSPIYKINNKNINITYIYTVHKNWREGTNSKFNSILYVIDKYRYVDKNSYIYYFDADTNIIKDFTTEWFIGDIVGGEHFANDNRMLNIKDYDRNPLSKSYIPFDTPLPQIYYLGAFFGGKIDNIFNICTILNENQKYDKDNYNYEPVFNDESYINNYFHYNPPSKIILFKDFEFVTSDKGDIGNVEHFTNNCRKIKYNKLIFYFIILILIILIILYFIIFEL
jgi:hypothetical protein